MAKGKALPPVSSMDLLRSLYQELAAPFVPYFTTILKIAWRDGSPDTEEAITHQDKQIPERALDKQNYSGASNVTPDRQFAEETCGSLYAPVSALGYRSFNYEWALLFKIDCDLARKKTGDIMDGASHYLSDIAAGDKIVQRRSVLNNYHGGRFAKTNTEDLENRYLSKMKNLTKEERKEISAWLRKNKKKLNESQTGENSFRHEDYEPKVSKCSVSISSGPDDASDEAFLSWLLNATSGGSKSSKKPQLDEVIPNSARVKSK